MQTIRFRIYISNIAWLLKTNHSLLRTTSKCTDHPWHTYATELWKQPIGYEVISAFLSVQRSIQKDLQNSWALDMNLYTNVVLVCARMQMRCNSWDENVSVFNVCPVQAHYSVLRLHRSEILMHLLQTQWSPSWDEKTLQELGHTRICIPQLNACMESVKPIQLQQIESALFSSKLNFLYY